MKAIGLISLVGLCASAHATFDLMLILQTLDRQNGSDTNVITRWDPVNGVFLGEFGAGLVGGTAIMLDPWQSRQVVNVYSSSQSIHIRRLDYSTGQNLGLTTLPIASTGIIASQMVAADQVLLAGTFSSAGDVRIYSTAGFLIRNYTMPAGTLQAMDALRAPDGTTYVLSRQAGSVSGNRFPLTSCAAGPSAIASSVEVLDNATRLLNDLVLSDDVLLIGGERWGMQHSTTVSGTDLGTPFGPWTGLGNGIFDTESWANGHADTIYGVGYDEDQSAMYFGSLSAQGGTTQYYSFSGTQYGDANGVAVVLAPEPGTILALGAGVGLLLRRRRK